MFGISLKQPQRMYPKKNTHLCFCCSEATAADTERSMQAGAGARDPANRDNPNAERNMHNRFFRANLSLPINIREAHHEVGHNDVITTPYVTVSDWLAYILKHCPCLLAGDQDLESQLGVFWSMYRWHHASHKVFQRQSEEALKRTVPVCVFGDEGRGLKRAGFMVLSWECPIGLKEQCVNECDCQEFLTQFPEDAVPSCQQPVVETPEASSAFKVDTNLKGHSYLTRHPLMGAAAVLYKPHPEIIQNVLDILANDLDSLFSNGIQVEEKQYFVALVGCKGDLKQQREFFATFTRSYANMGKKYDKLCCQHCFAGGPAHRFDLAEDEPSWASTLFQDRPWEEPPPFSRVPYDDSKPEQLYTFDFMHCFKLGLAREITGSLTVALCRLEFFDAPGDLCNLPARLQRAHGNFKLFCLANGYCAALRSFTPTFMNAKKASMYAWTNCKASDAILLLKWLLFFTGISQHPHLQPAIVRFLKTARTTVATALDLSGMCYDHGLWLRRRCAQAMYLRFMVMLRGYSSLADQVHNLGMTGFGYKPKYHAVHHLAWSLKCALRTPAPAILSPVIYACDGCEDLVGRVSRVSRRVSVRTAGRRVLQRVFLKTKAVLRRHLRLRKQSGKTR